uniref:Mevalonate kinase n=1 Tax=Ginkgo biloba TaxID=3311 RepID=A0A1S6KJR4_GINBI|nr:mevalonate kinase [Ginkgo biloba]
MVHKIAEVTGRAPGKLILCGEHAVVHGSTALAASLGLYTQVRIQNSISTAEPDGHLTIQLTDMNMHFTWPIKRIEAAFQSLSTFDVDPLSVKSCSPDIMQCIAAIVDEQEFPEAIIGVAAGVSALLFLYISIIGFKPATVIVASDIPLGSGLGSSAALCVAGSGAMLAFSGALDLDVLQGDWLSLKEKKQEIVNKWAYEGEKIIHGKPSGIDNTVSTFGNLVKFKSGHLVHIPNVFPIKMLITNTKVGRNTKALVAGVSERALRHPQSMMAVFTAVNAISEEMAEIIQAPFSDDISISEQEGKMEELMEMNQGLLQCMGVSHSAIEAVLQTTSRYKLCSKLTGAGGGGCVLTLLPKLLSGKVVDKVKADLESQGFQCFLATIGGEGVQVCFQCSSS